MKLFERLFNKHLLEDVSVASALGGSPLESGIGPYEIEYAGGRDGDNRLPTGGKKQAKKEKKKTKKKHNGEINVLIPLQKRPFNTDM